MNYEKLDNELKELVKYWIEKYRSDMPHAFTGIGDNFTEKYLTPKPVIEIGKYYRGSQENNSELMYYCTSFNQNGDPLGYGFDVYGDWTREDGYSWTKEVVEISENEWNERVNIKDVKVEISDEILGHIARIDEELKQLKSKVYV